MSDTERVAPLDVLVVAPHPDDAELGMGGAILRFKAEGWRVGVVDLTSGEPTPHGSPEIRAQETAAATKILGLDWRENLGLPNRSLEPTLAARAALAGVFRRLKPRLLFAPYWVDAHPDHQAAVELVEAARFWSKLTKTDLPGRAASPVANSVLLLRPLAARRASGVRAGYQRPVGPQAGGDRVLSQPIHRGPADRAADVHGSTCAIRRPTGDGRSAPRMVNRSPAASRSALPAFATCCDALREIIYARGARTAVLPHFVRRHNTT